MSETKPKREPRKVIVVEKKQDANSSLSTGKEALEKTLSSLQARANSGALDFDEVRSLCATVESLLKISKDERENMSKYEKLSDEELLKLALEAITLLKK